MKKYLIILFYQFTLLSFITAVGEIDIGDYDNTFFDAYDYYTSVSSDHRAGLTHELKTLDPIVNHHFLFIASTFVFIYIGSGNDELHLPYNDQSDPYPQKLFLKHHSLLI